MPGAPLRIPALMTMLPRLLLGLAPRLALWSQRTLHGVERALNGPKRLPLGKNLPKESI